MAAASAHSVQHQPFRAVQVKVEINLLVSVSVCVCVCVCVFLLPNDHCTWNTCIPRLPLKKSVLKECDKRKD